MNRCALSKATINDQKTPGWFEGSALFLDFQKSGGSLSVINGFGIDGLYAFMANSNYISFRALIQLWSIFISFEGFFTFAINYYINW